MQRKKQRVLMGENTVISVIVCVLQALVAEFYKGKT